MLDGFDLQLAAFAAGGIRATWHVSPQLTGFILSASLVGVFLGALGLSPLADRFGRKRLVLLCALMFGGFSCCAAVAPSPETFMLFRMLTGIGLGGAMPGLIALVAEVAPAHARGRYISAMFVGLPAGAFVGGLVSGPLMDAFSWRGLFWVGGIIPLVLLPLLIAVLPRDSESVRAAVPQDDGGGKLRELTSLFAAERSRVTLLLWIAFFMNLLLMHVLSAWLPTLLKTGGLSARESLIDTSMFHFGGILGGLGLGRLIDRRDPIRILVYTFAAGCVAVVGAAYAAQSFLLFLPCAVAVGASSIGAQVLLNATAALVYPATVRATGVGWALGMGRWGSILGPIAVGALVAAGWSTQAIVLSVIAPMTFAGVAMVLQPRNAVGRPVRPSGT